MPSGTSTPLAADPICPICHDSGLYRIDRPIGDPEFGKLHVCPCQAERESARLRSLSGLHGDELMITLADIALELGPGTRQMVEACRAFIAKPTGTLTLWGGPGNAKSTALRAVVNELSRMGAVYVTAFDLVSYIRAAFDRAGAVQNDDAYSRLARFERIGVLAIDEFDKVRVTDWVAEQLTALIDARHRLGLSGEAGTLLAMNSDPSSQPEWIFSRLNDGRNRIVHNGDRDVRPYIDGA